jgi:phosphohistidine phosphatase
MTRLYFLRHGLAANRSEWSGNDSERPLTSKGQALMAREAQTIAQLDLQLDLILTSPLVRALQTARIVAEALGMQERLQADERLAPGFGVPALAEVLKERSGVSALMLVGHEPDFSETIGALIGGGRVVCKKGGLARVDLPDDGSLAGELVWLIPPGVLGRH